MLSQLQELGHPPPDLMKKIHENDPNSAGNPLDGLGQGMEGMPPGMAQMMASLGNLGGPTAAEASTTPNTDNS